ncbi:Adipokinetic hormone receptor [Carabus blaptoides fortunei]
MVSDVLGVELSNDRTNTSCVSSAPDEMAVTNVFTPSPLVSVSASWLNESTVDQTTDNNDTYPSDLRFNENSLTVVIVYCVLFLVAAVGNLTVFITLFKSRHRKSRISLMITHLAVADLMVTFIMIPLEVLVWLYDFESDATQIHNFIYTLYTQVGWRLTVQWLAGNLACKVFLFLRAFGLYLSSNVLVCVSLDRYFAILHPLRVNDARRRGKLMLACAWIVSLLWSVPQQQTGLLLLSKLPELTKIPN